MPTPAGTPNTANDRPNNKVDFGNRLAKKRSQEFAAKIAQWNTNGGGVAPVVKAEPVVKAVTVDSTSRSVDAEDDAIIQIVTPEENKENEDGVSKDDVVKPQTTSKPTTPRKGSTGIDVNRKAWVRRKSKTQAEKPAKIDITADVKHAGTPKKRVVSDGHWRRDRLAKPSEPVDLAEESIPKPSPKPVITKTNAASRDLKVVPTVSTSTEEPERPRRRRHRIASRSRSRSISRERNTSRQETPDYESSGTKLYVKRRQPSKTDSRPVSRDFKSSESSLTTSSVDKRASTGQTTPVAALSPIKMLTPPSAVVARYLNTLMPVQDQVNPEEPAEKPSDAKTRRRRSNRRVSRPLPEPESDVNNQDEPDKQDTNASPLGLPVVFGNRIEGWLAHTSDPFKDTKPQTREEEPRRSSHRRSSRNYNHDTPETPRSRHTRSDSHSAEYESNLSPLTSTLKRSGARRTPASPIKDRSSRDVTPALESHEMKPRRRRSHRREAPFQRFQNAAHELSTIMSAEDLHTRSDYEDDRVPNPDPSVLSRASDGDERKPAVPLKRRLTKHSDLISVLSVERSSSKRIRPRHSTRVKNNHQDLTIGDVMNDITTDELKYQRELRTLVDGVIPVLLNYVLSSNTTPSSLLAANRDTQVLTKPIVEMGVALERLKSIHKRIPMHHSADLIAWAISAKDVYAEYLRAWRLGYQDIVVNLAPAEGAEKQNSPRWDDGLPRNKQGELTSNDGERVDVAYLLKRPLVRLKHLCKAFETIESIDSSAREAAKIYHELVQLAKTRANEEKARLEDEAAAAIDATRARECRTLDPISGVQIDATRCVRARDFFDLDLRHSNGQQLNCKIELVMRDDAPGKGEAGDILFCEVSPLGRWLLFPPVHSTMISARQGRKERQLVVMLRGYRNDGREWREVLALEADEEETVAEWLTMLPSSPVPRNLATKSSFDLQKMPMMSGALPDPSLQTDNRLSIVQEMDIPIGEQTIDAAKTWNASEVNSDVGDLPTDVRRARYRSQPATILEHEHQFTNRDSQSRFDTRPKSEQFTRKPDHGQYEDRHDQKNDYGDQTSRRQVSEGSSADEDDRPIPRRPSMHRRTSSVPSMDLPMVRKLRKTTQTISPRKQETSQPDSIVSFQDRIENDPSSAPAKLQRRRSTPPEAHSTPTKQKESRPSSLGLKSLPSFTPAFLKKHRRSSSPLKHEYEPSTASSDSESEVSAVEHEESFTSEEQPAEDQVSTLGELKSFPTTGGYRPMKQVSRPSSVWSPSDPSLAPSESASQSPYRSVPPAETKAAETVASIFAWAESGVWESLHPEECFIVVTPGLIEAFDNAQAHAAPAANEEEAMQSPSARGVKPLVALELTPLVPLRRGTALDISIRSQPSPNSLYRTGNNIMFRSRNTEECEALYHMLNRARIDNPTYIALQRARGPVPQSNWGEMMERQINERPSSSWWNLRSKKSSTYRSNSISRPQSIAATESSIGTMNTAFSALRRFSGSNRFFNIAKSTITSRQGTRSTYSDSLDSGVASPAVLDPSLGTPLGLTNMKIRLYIRETASKWRDMGAARLTILIPPRPDPLAPASPFSTGREKRVIISGKTQGETLLDATLGEACFERIARTGIAISVWKENIDGMVANTGGVLAAKTSVYMVQMKSDREAAYTFGLVGKLRY